MHSDALARRREIRALRTQLWFDSVCRISGCEGPAAVERLVEPLAAERAREGLYHGNKWFAYKAGRRTPQRRLVLRTEAVAAGSLAVFDHVLWATLDGRRPLGLRGSRLLHRLGAETQAAMFRRGRRRPLQNRLLTRLEVLGGLDALAACTVLFRESVEARAWAGCRELALTIIRLLLIEAVLGLRVAHGLYDFYSTRFVEAGAGQKSWLALENYDFGLSAQLLAAATMKSIELGTIRNNRLAAVRYMRGLLRGRRSLKWRWALMPESVTAGQPIDLHRWALESILSGDDELIPMCRLENISTAFLLFR